jgi:hypothetical protein
MAPKISGGIAFHRTASAQEDNRSTARTYGRGRGKNTGNNFFSVRKKRHVQWIIFLFHSRPKCRKKCYPTSTLYNHKSPIQRDLIYLIMPISSARWY